MRFHEFYRGDWWRNSTLNGVSKSARGGRAGSGQKRPHFAHFENFLKKNSKYEGNDLNFGSVAEEAVEEPVELSREDERRN